MGRWNHRNSFYTLLGATMGLIALLATFAGPVVSSSDDPAMLGDVQDMAIPRAHVKATWTKIPHSASMHTSKYYTYNNDFQPAPAYVNSPGAHTSVINDPGSLALAKAKKKKKLSKKKLGLGGKKSTSFSSKRNNKLSATPEGSGYSNNGGGTASRPNANQKKKEDEENMNSVEYWQQPIFQQQDMAALGKLIDAFQAKKVSNGVFYQLVDEMSHDERSLLREYGLAALSATPSSKSFNGLSWVKHNETISTIQTGATREIASYSEASQLGHVVGALRVAHNNNDNGVTALEAMRVLSDAAKKYSDVRTQDTKNPATTTTSSASVEQRMAQALNIIKNQFSTSTNPTLKNEATKTIAAINKLIGS